MKRLRPGQQFTFNCRPDGDVMMLMLKIGGAQFEIALEPVDVLRFSELLRKSVADTFPVTAHDD
jgi:hypothetical protein